MLRSLSLTSCLLLLFSSCMRSPIKVESDYVNRESLASYHVRTPDPRLNCPPVGQRLILTWAISGKLFKRKKLHIEMTIVYGDHSEEVKVITPKCPWGLDITYLLNDDYCDKCGILTYKATLFCGETALYEWRHQLWTEIITFDS